MQLLAYLRLMHRLFRQQAVVPKVQLVRLAVAELALLLYHLFVQHVLTDLQVNHTNLPGNFRQERLV